MLYEHQTRFLNKRVKKGLLVHATGTGKTRTSIVWFFEQALWAEKPMSLLIVCPKYLKTKWEKEVYNANPEIELTIKTMLGSKQILIVSKEEFRRDWEKYDKYDSIIIDEAHYFAGMKSQMSKNMMKYIKKHNVENILGLTATPFMSSPMNIYTLGKILGKTDYKWSYMYFMQEFYNQVPMGMRVVPVIKKGIESKLSKKVKEIADVVSMEECVDLPDNTLEVELFTLTKEQEREIKNLQEINHLTRWTKIHQICGGYLKGDGYNEDKIIKSDKFDRVIELIKENKKIMVVCRYVGEVEMIAGEIINSNDEAFKDKKVLMIHGDVKDKQSIVDEANKSDDCVLLVTAACSEGWEAPTFSTMVFYSYDFSLKNYIQMKGRIQRINAIHRCTYISLVVEGTIDDDVYTNVAKKKTDFHLSIYKKNEVPKV